MLIQSKAHGLTGKTLTEYFVVLGSTAFPSLEACNIDRDDKFA